MFWIVKSKGDCVFVCMYTVHIYLFFSLFLLRQYCAWEADDNWMNATCPSNIVTLIQILIITNKPLSKDYYFHYFHSHRTRQAWLRWKRKEQTNKYTFIILLSSFFPLLYPIPLLIPAFSLGSPHDISFRYLPPLLPLILVSI